MSWRTCVVVKQIQSNPIQNSDTNAAYSTKPLWSVGYSKSIGILSAATLMGGFEVKFIEWDTDGLVQERCNFIANAPELRILH